MLYMGTKYEADICVTRDIAEIWLNLTRSRCYRHGWVRDSEAEGWFRHVVL